jgi:hypothetical protein
VETKVEAEDDLELGECMSPWTTDESRSTLTRQDGVDNASGVVCSSVWRSAVYWGRVVAVDEVDDGLEEREERCIASAATAVETSSDEERER